MTGPPVRLLVLWCPDWPVVAAAAAAGIAPHVPAAVFSTNRVVARSAVARRSGVRRDMRRREAQSRCPELAVLGVDPDRDARLFEPVAAAVEELIVGVEVVRPGVVAVPVSGASGYFGGEDRLAELLLDHVPAKAGVECQIGVADGLFAALLAAHRSVRVDAGAGAEFLAPLGIGELNQPGSDRTDLVDLLRRLGLRTLGAFAALSERDVTTRFGVVGLVAHRLARGLSDRPPNRRRPPPELSLVERFDDPLDRIDAAAFVARSLAERFHAVLAGSGLACTRLGIEATTANGEELARVWRCAEPLTAPGIADRVRWQFDGWLRAADGIRPTAGVVELRLVPEETVAGRSLQLGLWRGGTGVDGSLDPAGEEQVLAAERAGRALVRVQGLLGPDGVVTAVLAGGRGPAERVRLIPWGDVRPDADEQPWPGRLPAPSPATVYQRRIPVDVRDVSGLAVRLDERNLLTGAPHLASVDGSHPRRVLDWAGPWQVVRRWWARDDGGPFAHMQVLLAAVDEQRVDMAFLLLGRLGDEHNPPQWTIEGKYD
ncbi:protein ImuB [Herbihabitans rhizosphaerae]|uniref:Protein ImuB n=1 Tax=Herbihabitans rhizosphaerae TaxID=1872711 RepID=A0A4Q7KJW0_9PSEU|nr:DNA polymerase Y family protein [Herbihabitans rhizosphaerae]RZS36487.1 protein ImuB [Herbihabitans rhizosphaerae]